RPPLCWRPRKPASDPEGDRESAAEEASWAILTCTAIVQVRRSALGGPVRIKSIEISNIKSLRYFHLDHLPDLVVLAGPNGAGKTTVFDALRIFKEAIAGYSLRAPGQSQISNLMHNLGPVVTAGQLHATIQVTFTVSDREREFLALPDGHA